MFHNNKIVNVFQDEEAAAEQRKRDIEAGKVEMTGTILKIVTFTEHPFKRSPLS